MFCDVYQQAVVPTHAVGLLIIFARYVLSNIQLRFIISIDSVRKRLLA
jgi:hypothetical protein